MTNGSLLIADSMSTHRHAPLPFSPSSPRPPGVSTPPKRGKESAAVRVENLLS